MIEFLIGWMTKPEYGWTFTDKVVILSELLVLIAISIVIEIILIKKENEKQSKDEKKNE